MIPVPVIDFKKLLNKEQCSNLTDHIWYSGEFEDKFNVTEEYHTVRINVATNIAKKVNTISAISNQIFKKTGNEEKVIEFLNNELKFCNNKIVELAILSSRMVSLRILGFNEESIADAKKCKSILSSLRNEYKNSLRNDDAAEFTKVRLQAENTYDEELIKNYYALGAHQKSQKVFAGMKYYHDKNKMNLHIKRLLKSHRIN